MNFVPTKRAPGPLAPAAICKMPDPTGPRAIEQGEALWALFQEDQVEEWDIPDLKALLGGDNGP